VCQRGCHQPASGHAVERHAPYPGHTKTKLLASPRIRLCQEQGLFFPPCHDPSDSPRDRGRWLCPAPADTVDVLEVPTQPLSPRVAQSRWDHFPPFSLKKLPVKLGQGARWVRCVQSFREAPTHQPKPRGKLYHLPTPSPADVLRIHQNIQKNPKGEPDGKPDVSEGRGANASAGGSSWKYHEMLVWTSPTRAGG